MRLCKQHIYGIRTHPRLTHPRRTLPRWTRSQGTRPRRDGHFLDRTLPRLDISPTDTSRRSNPRPDTSPTGHFHDQTLYDVLYYDYISERILAYFHFTTSLESILQST